MHKLLTLGTKERFQAEKVSLQRSASFGRERTEQILRECLCTDNKLDLAPMTKLPKEVSELINVLLKEREKTRKVEEERHQLYKKLEQTYQSKKENEFKQLKQEVEQLKRNFNQASCKSKAVNHSEQRKPHSQSQRERPEEMENASRLERLQKKYLNLKTKYMETAMKTVE